MKYRKWTDEEEKELINSWGQFPTDAIAVDLGRTYQSVYMKARTLKLGPNKVNEIYHWTKEEEEYLEDSWGTVRKRTIAEKLGRTIVAVNLKAQRMNLGAFLNSGDYITVNQLMNELKGTYLGKNYTLEQWMEKGMPVRNQIVNEDRFRVINLDKFWEWAEKNRTLIDFSRLEPLVFGEEPKWLIKQRRIDKENNYFKKTPWTEGEDKRLKSMLMEYRYNYRELSIRLRRTEGAIKRRMVDLGIKVRPLRMPNHRPWTEEETNLLIKLYHKGHGRNTYANYINRSAQACSGKIERLIKEGVIEPRNEHRKTC